MNGADDSFFVLVDGVEPTFTEATNDNIRRVDVSFPKDTTEIGIIGTQAVPEFGTFSILILMIAISGCIIGFRKFSVKS